MAFKDDSSFMRFVTMGALGTRRAWQSLERQGHSIIELERYSASNKIWATKIKRLRLADLMCVSCGRRFEVRAKSNLEIKMSHAEANPDRYWDNGLRDEDAVIFVQSRDVGKIEIAETLNVFSVRDLRRTQKQAKLGPPKSASEGAERDLTWPSWTPSGNGTVVSVGDTLKVTYETGRNYTYALKGKHAYVRPGERFKGDEQILAGVPAKKGELTCPGEIWTPTIKPRSPLPDLYAVVKATGKRNIASNKDALLACLSHEDNRLRLEAAGVLLKMGEKAAAETLFKTAVLDGEDAPWAMEAVLILSEIREPIAIELLSSIAASGRHSEARAAATWGLGMLNAPIEKLIPLLDDKDADVACHSLIAIAARISTADDTHKLIQEFASNVRRAAGAAEALSLSPGSNLDLLLTVASRAESPQAQWAFAALSRAGSKRVEATQGWTNAPEALKLDLRKTWFREDQSWCANTDVATRIDLLIQQQLSLS